MINIYPTRSCYDLGKQKLLFIVLSILLHYTELANRRVSKEKTLWDCFFSWHLHCFVLPMPSSGLLSPTRLLPCPQWLHYLWCWCPWLPLHLPAARTHSQTSRVRRASPVPRQLGVMMQLVPQKPISSFKEGRGKKGRGKSLWSTLKLLCHPSLPTFTDQTSFNIFAE